jgi:hypothetical protein
MSLVPGHLLVSTTEGLIYCFVPTEKTDAASDSSMSAAVEDLRSPALAGESDHPHQGY